MVRTDKKLRWDDGVLSRTGAFRRRFLDYGISSDRIGAPIPGRQARHDGIAMCLLRKDIAHAMPMRKAQRVARNRRVLVLLWIFVTLWWMLGWLFF